MEVTSKNKIPWLDETHPNYKRWKRARIISEDRGRLVEFIVNKHIKCKNLSILDLGSGEGGTSKVFSENNFVVSFDLNLIRLQRQKDFAKNFSRVKGNGSLLPFSDHSFNLIILQDVIEHTGNEGKLIEELSRILKPNGIIYLSTPNKSSLFNLLSDPHWGVPLIAGWKREAIRKYFLKYFRKNELNRNDVAQLLSLEDLKKILKKDFIHTLHTKTVVSELFKGNKGIIWSSFHLKLLRFIKMIKIDKLVTKISNDEEGILNKFFTPTFYIVCRKKN